MYNGYPGNVVRWNRSGVIRHRWIISFRVLEYQTRESTPPTLFRNPLEILSRAPPHKSTEYIMSEDELDYGATVGGKQFRRVQEQREQVHKRAQHHR